MNNLQVLLDLCDSYKNGEFGVEEFQSRIQTVLLPDNTSKEFLIKLHNICNDLEEIIYFFPESEQRMRTIIVADNISKAAILEQSRLKEFRNHK